MTRANIRAFLVVTLAACALPVAAHAQVTGMNVEHDWRLIIGGGSYGLVQGINTVSGLPVAGSRHTTICLGPHSRTTRLRAPYVVSVMLLPFGAAGAVLLTRLWARSPAA